MLLWSAVVVGCVAGKPAASTESAVDGDSSALVADSGGDSVLDSAAAAAEEAGEATPPDWAPGCSLVWDDYDLSEETEDGSGDDELYSYDAENRLLRWQDLGSEYRTNYLYTYDADGKLLSFVDAYTGESWVYLYNTDGTVAEMDTVAGGTSPPVEYFLYADGYLSEVDYVRDGWTYFKYTYDHAGNVLSFSYYSDVDTLDHTDVSVYDADNRLLTLTEYTGNALDLKFVQTSTYDGAGTRYLWVQTAADGTTEYWDTWTYVHSADGMTVTEEDFDADGNELNYVTTYDAAGNPLTQLTEWWGGIYSTSTWFYLDAC